MRSESTVSHQEIAEAKRESKLKVLLEKRAPPSCKRRWGVKAAAKAREMEYGT